MQRALLPNVLASLGLILIVWATTMPLFEWKISEINAEFPSTYKVHLDPSPWITKLGESLDDSSYVFHKVLVSIDQKVCINEEEFNIAIGRSRNEKAFELISINIDNSISWLALWSLIEIVLSGIYMWWVTIWYEHRPISNAIISTVIVALIFCFLMGVLRLLGPKVSTDYFLISDECYGTLTLNARLSKVHYETLIVFFAGILLELGALGIMLRQIIMAVIQPYHKPSQK